MLIRSRLKLFKVIYRYKCFCTVTFLLILKHYLKMHCMFTRHWYVIFYGKVNVYKMFFNYLLNLKGNAIFIYNIVMIYIVILHPQYLKYNNLCHSAVGRRTLFFLHICPHHQIKQSIWSHTSKNKLSSTRETIISYSLKSSEKNPFILDYFFRNSILT